MLAVYCSQNPGLVFTENTRMNYIKVHCIAYQRRSHRSRKKNPEKKKKKTASSVLYTVPSWIALCLGVRCGDAQAYLVGTPCPRFLSSSQLFQLRMQTSISCVLLTISPAVLALRLFILSWCFHFLRKTKDFIKLPLCFILNTQMT